MSMVCKGRARFPGRGWRAGRLRAEPETAQAESTPSALPHSQHLPQQLKGLTSPWITQQAGSTLSGQRELILPYLELYY